MIIREYHNEHSPSGEAGTPTGKTFKPDPATCKRIARRNGLMNDKEVRLALHVGQRVYTSFNYYVAEGEEAMLDGDRIEYFIEWQYRNVNGVLKWGRAEIPKRWYRYELEEAKERARQIRNGALRNQYKQPIYDRPCRVVQRRTSDAVITTLT